MLMVGVSIPLSLAKRSLTESYRQQLAHAVQRTIVLFLLGSVRESISLGSPYLVELSSALQPIAIASFVAFLVARKSWRFQASLAGIILTVNALVLAFVPAPGIPAGSYAFNHNLVHSVDIALLGQHHWDIWPYRNEGWGTVLVIIPAIATTLIGLLIGKLLMTSRSMRSKAAIICGMGVGFLIAGMLAAFMSNFAATVNSAPPYLVNDIYKRFINPNASLKTYVRLSYLASLAVVVIGVAIGWYVTSVNSVVLWLVSGLWGGYTASNMMKWYWWRFNGFGYFWGMVVGITSSLTLPLVIEKVPIVQYLLTQYSINLNVSIIFPLTLIVSLIGCFAGTLLTKQDDEEVLKDFYRRVRPWGFWGPILKKVLAEDPSFKRNRDFPRDMFNIAVGILWQVSLVTLPLYIVIQEYQRAAIALAAILVTSAILKFTWYDHLAVREVEPAKIFIAGKS